MDYGNQIPTLEQLCYELLAAYSGYIDDVSVLRDDSILEICKKSDIFGLANLESITDGMDLDLSDIWESLYQKLRVDCPGFFTDEVQYLCGENYYKQALFTSILRRELENRTLDDEDLTQLIGDISKSLKLLTFHSAPSLDPSLFLPQFSTVIHLDMSNSKIGPSIGPVLAQVIPGFYFLHTLNLRNVILKDEGCLLVAEALEQSQSVNNVDMAFNDISIDGVRRMVTCVLNKPQLIIVNLSRNLGPRFIKEGYNLKRQVNRQRPLVKFDLV